MIRAMSKFEIMRSRLIKLGKIVAAVPFSSYSATNSGAGALMYESDMRELIKYVNSFISEVQMEEYLDTEEVCPDEILSAMEKWIQYRISNNWSSKWDKDISSFLE